MNDDLYPENPLAFISLKIQRSAKKKKVLSCPRLPFSDLLVSSSHKGAVYDGEPRNPREFYVRGSLISFHT